MNVSPLGWILASNIFLNFIILVGGLASVDIVQSGGYTNSLSIPDPPAGILAVPGWLFQTAVFFFQFLFSSSDTFFFGVVILVPFILTNIYLILQLVGSFVP